MKILKYSMVCFLVIITAFAPAKYLFAEDIQSTEWELTVTSQDEDANSLDLVIGTSSAAGEGFNSGLDQYAPPAPPNGSFDSRIVDGSEDYFKRFRPLTTTVSSWNIRVRPSSTGELITLSWNSSQISSVEGFFFLQYEVSGQTQILDMTSDQVAILDAGEQEVTIQHIIQEPVTGDYSTGWQLVGSPVDADSLEPANVFTNFIPGTFFNYQGVYSEEEIFTRGGGYWTRLSDAETIEFNSPLLNEVSFAAEPRWFLISGPGLPVAFNDIDDPAGALVAGTLQGYENGYFVADTLMPGKGYWVQSQGTGTVSIIADYTSLTKQKTQSVVTTPEGFSSFAVNNDENHSLTFYMGGDLDSQSSVNPLSFSMPPLPPNGAFDIRFENDSRLTSGNGATLIVRSPGEVLNVSHLQSTGEQITFEFTREESTELEQYTLSPGEDVSIQGEGINTIQVTVGMVNSVTPGSGNELPVRMELSQNYPNPFNPATVISYQLPESGSVSLEVFDMTGRRVAILQEGMRTAGSHTVEFNASQLSSGVYMYRLQSAGNTLTRKMSLIK